MSFTAAFLNCFQLFTVDVAHLISHSHMSVLDLSTDTTIIIVIVHALGPVCPDFLCITFQNFGSLSRGLLDGVKFGDNGLGIIKLRRTNDLSQIFCCAILLAHRQCFNMLGESRTTG
ncbi:hypothetical protein C5167_036855 [Papaver somniferum]|uniref:Uncharacterized protein n=1 Tax=Papaver somniferum TaxID=3469 RepID=A0A4Y7I555_PAPSO|nr:hypothetical protein C5167_036855 [Papaver somniferum]